MFHLYVSMNFPMVTEFIIHQQNMQSHIVKSWFRTNKLLQALPLFSISCVFPDSHYTGNTLNLQMIENINQR